MKTYIQSFAGMLALAISVSSIAASLPNDIVVDIDFGSPSGYTDIEIDGFSGEREQAVILDLIRVEFEENASKYLPNGYTLRIQVRDIDLAGYHEPLYSGYDDIRIMRSVYPPRLEFSYTVLDDEQIIIEQGDPSLIDLNYLWKMALPSQRNDTAFYVKSLLKDWARHDLGYALK
jgi:hypothetical protein